LFDRATGDCSEPEFYNLKVGKQNAKFDGRKRVEVIKLLRHFIPLGYDGAPLGGQKNPILPPFETRKDRLPVEIKIHKKRATALFRAASQTPNELRRSSLSNSSTPRRKILTGSVMPASGANEQRDSEWDQKRQIGFRFGSGVGAWRH